MEIKTWNQIVNRLESIKFNERFDLIVAIGRGGIVPGCLIAGREKLDFGILWLKYRNEDNEIMFDKPKLVKNINFDFKDKNILLVDDVSRTGQTFEEAKKYLAGAKVVRSFVVNGQADYHLYNEECFKFPWS